MRAWALGLAFAWGLAVMACATPELSEPRSLLEGTRLLPLVALGWLASAACVGTAPARRRPRALLAGLALPVALCAPQLALAARYDAQLAAPEATWGLDLVVFAVALLALWSAALWSGAGESRWAGAVLLLAGAPPLLCAALRAGGGLEPAWGLEALARCSVLWHAWSRAGSEPGAAALALCGTLGLALGALPCAPKGRAE